MYSTRNNCGFINFVDARIWPKVRTTLYVYSSSDFATTHQITFNNFVMKYLSNIDDIAGYYREMIILTIRIYLGNPKVRTTNKIANNFRLGLKILSCHAIRVI